MILLDANILIHSKQAASPHYAAITQRLADFAGKNEELAICPQVLYEYYAAVTRPKGENGYGIPTQEAMQQVDKFLIAYTFITEPEDLFTQWQAIIKKYNTIGKTAHDAKLVALMQAQAIDTIYTMNPKDFNRYADIINIV